jgi:hypothetical protein
VEAEQTMDFRNTLSINTTVARPTGYFDLDKAGFAKNSLDQALEGSRV